MQMAPALQGSLLGLGGFLKLIGPRPMPLHKIPLWGSIVFLSVQTVFFQHGDCRNAPWSYERLLIVMDLRGCVSHPSSQCGLRCLSGAPQRAMEPLKVATGVLAWEKAPTTEKHFLVILAGPAQFHPRDQPTFALELPSLQSGTDLRVCVFFQFLHHHLSTIFKQIHGTSFLGALEPQLAKLGLGVDAIDVFTRMKGACFIQELVQLGVHLIEVLVFLGRLGLTRPFL